MTMLVFCQYKLNCFSCFWMSKGTSQHLWSTPSSSSRPSARMLAARSETSGSLWPSAPSWARWPTEPRWPFAEPSQARQKWATWPLFLACSKWSRVLWPASYSGPWPTGVTTSNTWPPSTALSSTSAASSWPSWLSWWRSLAGPKVCAVCPLTAAWWCAPWWRCYSTWARR